MIVGYYFKVYNYRTLTVREYVWEKSFNDVYTRFESEDHLAFDTICVLKIKK